MNRGRPRHPDILTPREWEVLALLREGISNAQIAERLGITERTAKFHVSEILSKLGLADRQEAAAWKRSPLKSKWMPAIAITGAALLVGIAAAVTVVSGILVTSREAITLEPGRVIHKIVEERNETGVPPQAVLEYWTLVGADFNEEKGRVFSRDPEGRLLQDGFTDASSLTTANYDAAFGEVNAFPRPLQQSVFM